MQENVHLFLEFKYSMCCYFITLSFDSKMIKLSEEFIFYDFFSHNKVSFWTGLFFILINKQMWIITRSTVHLNNQEIKQDHKKWIDLTLNENKKVFSIKDVK